MHGKRWRMATAVVVVAMVPTLSPTTDNKRSVSERIKYIGCWVLLHCTGNRWDTNLPSQLFRFCCVCKQKERLGQMATEKKYLNAFDSVHKFLHRFNDRGRGGEESRRIWRLCGSAHLSIALRWTQHEHIKTMHSIEFVLSVCFDDFTLAVVSLIFMTIIPRDASSFRIHNHE